MLNFDVFSSFFSPGWLARSVEVGWGSRVVASGPVRPCAAAEAAGHRPRVTGTPQAPPGPRETAHSAAGDRCLSKVFFYARLFEPAEIQEHLVYSSERWTGGLQRHPHGFLRSHGDSSRMVIACIIAFPFLVK